MENYSTSTFKFEIPKVSIYSFLSLLLLSYPFYLVIEKLFFFIMSFNDKEDHLNYFLQLKLTGFAGIIFLLITIIISLFFLMLKPKRSKYESYIFKTKNRFIHYFENTIKGFGILISIGLIIDILLGFGFITGLYFGMMIGLAFFIIQTPFDFIFKM